jgi:hypothetical protein
MSECVRMSAKRWFLTTGIFFLKKGTPQYKTLLGFIFLQKTLYLRHGKEKTTRWSAKFSRFTRR